MPNAAVYYVPDSFTTAREGVMGRHAAGEGFLRGYARWGTDPTLYCFARTQRLFELFKNNIKNDVAASRTVQWIPFTRMEMLSRPGCMFVPSPVIGRIAWQRRRIGAKTFGICGVTHTTATQGIMSALGDLLVAPVQSWDAVVCTSSAVEAMVRTLLEGWRSYLAQRLGARATAIRAQLPVIPLGVDCERYSPSALSAARRRRFRERHRIGETDIAVLFAGRLSFHAKANPLPMYLALEEAARETGRCVFLIHAGRFSNESIEAAFRSGAQLFCPSVHAIFVDGRQAEEWSAVWAAADVFTSLSDNIQEAFGLTPLEAMAAGLPVVVSDWDGYRDTVEDGVQGFRIPTTMPPPPLGAELAWRYASGLDSYDFYIGHASQLTAVDIGACAQAYVTLIREPALRHSMGEAGRRRALALFDWSRIVVRYEALWGELEARRERDAECPNPESGEATEPLQDDPFHIFQSYPSYPLEEHTSLALRRVDYRPFVRSVRNHPLGSLASRFLATEEECDAILADLAAHPDSLVSEVLERTASEERRSILYRTLAWLAKLGLLTPSRRGDR